MEGKTPIGRVLSSSVCWDGMTDWRFWRCSAGLSGEMHAGQCHATICFLTLFQLQPPREKALVPVLRSMTALGLQPFLAYPAVIKLRHEVNRDASILFGKRRIFVGSLSQSGTFAADPQGSGRAAAALSSIRREGLGDRYGGEWWRERYGWSLVQFLIFSSFLSPHGIVFFFLFDTIVPLLTNPLFFCLFLFSGGE